MKQIMKRAVTFLLAIAMIVTILPGKISAADVTGDSNVITGFTALDASEKSITINADARPSEADLIAAMPKTLSVYLGNSPYCSTVNVSWYCITEDYDTSEAFYFQYSPVIDSSYVLDSSIDLLTDAPYVGVFVSDEETLSLASDIEADDISMTEDGIFITSDTDIARLGIAAPSASVINSDNAKAIFTYLTTEVGYNSAAACGTLANIYCESGFVADRTEYGYTWETGAGYGICQWTNYPRTSATGRRTNLVNYCTKNGFDYKSLDGQLHFLHSELSGGYKTKVDDRMRGVENSAQGTYDAGYIWCYYFEVPKDYQNVAITRGNLARDYFWPAYGTINAYAVAGGLQVDWSGVFKASYFHLYRGMYGSNYVPIATYLTDTSYLDTTVMGGVKYSYLLYGYTLPTAPAETPEQLVSKPTELTSTCRIVPDADTTTPPESEKSETETTDSTTTDSDTTAPGTSDTDKTEGSVSASTPKEITGTVTINGIVAVGNELVAAISDYTVEETTEALLFSFQWKRDGVTIEGATSSTYTLTQEDMGKTLSCIVTSNLTTGYIQADTNRLMPANYSVPAIASTSPTSVKGGLDGVISLTSDVAGAALEYSLTADFAQTFPVTDNKIIGATGNYYIRYAASDCANAGSIIVAQIADMEGTSTVDYYYLAAPAITAENTTTGTTINWNAVAGATEYKIYRSINDGDFELLSTISNCSYSDLNATSSKSKYRYKVVAIYTDSANVEYSSTDSNLPTVYHLAQPKIKKIKNADNKMTLTWKAVANANAYKVYRKKSTKKNYTCIGTTNTNSFTDPKSYKNGITYNYKIVAIFNDGVGGISTSADSPVKSYMYLSRPKITKLSCLHSKSLSVFYSKNSKATGYQIQYSKYKDFHSKKTLKIVSSATGVWRITNLTKSKKYYVRVRSYRTIGKTTYYSSWTTPKRCKVTK